MERANSTGYCFRADDRRVRCRSDRPGQQGQPIEKAEELEQTSPIEAIYCKSCGRMVTSKEQKISVHGAHTHTFFNPAGIVFELGCFRVAPGCQNYGEATSDFTWFAGHVWRFALCDRCNSHLGWFFEMGERSFYGLVLANVRE